MNEVPNELEALRREVAELRAAAAQLRTELRSAGPRSAAPYRGGKLSKGAGEQGNKAGVGVYRRVQFYQAPHCSHSREDEPCWYDAASLPSEEKLIECAAMYAENPVAVRALYRFLERFLDGQPLPMSLGKPELAANMGIGELELENALRPLVAYGTLRWSKTATGSEYYEWVEPDDFLLLLAGIDAKLRRERRAAAG